MDDRVIAGRFQIDEALGRGGMGTVWRAHDQVLGRMVALKEVQIPSNLSPEGREDVRQRVIREARAAAKMSHPSAVTVYDVIEEDNHIFIAMELVGFPTLRALVEKDGPFTPQRAASTGLAILNALEVAHAGGIVHRDVKPANIMVGEEQVKLADFGVASIKGDPRLTATGMVIGSPSYMSPEQATGEAADPATDLWGLGATLFFATEGHGPFDRPGPMPTLMAIANEEPPAAENAGPLKDVISSLLSKDPQQRPTPERLRPMLAEVAQNDGSPAEDAPTDETSKTRTAVAAALPPTLTDTPVVPRTAAGGEPRAAVPPPPVEEVVERRPAGPPPGSPGLEPKGNGWMVAAGAMVLLLLAFLILPRLSNNEDPNPAEPGETAQADPPAPAAAPEPPPQEDEPEQPDDSEDTGGASARAGSLPDGWERASIGDTGYSIGHPSGWQAVQNPLGDGSSLRFQTSGGRYLLVDWTDQPRDDAAAAWEQLAESFASRHEDYREIRIERTGFRDFDTAAIWEWTYREGGAALHAANLGFADDEWGFALNFQTQQDDWEDSQDTFEQFQKSFGTD